MGACDAFRAAAAVRSFTDRAITEADSPIHEQGRHDLSPNCLPPIEDPRSTRAIQTGSLVVGSGTGVSGPLASPS